MHCGFAVVPNQIVVLVLVIAHRYDWLTFGKPSVQAPVVALGRANGIFRPMAMKHSSGFARASSVPVVVVRPVIGVGCAAACRWTPITIESVMTTIQPIAVLLLLRSQRAVIAELHRDVFTTSTSRRAGRCLPGRPETEGCVLPQALARRRRKNVRCRPGARNGSAAADGSNAPPSSRTAMCRRR